MAGYANRTVTKAPPWHGLVAWDMLFNSLSAGLFLVTALGELAAPAIFAPLAKVAYPLALILLLADLVCLILDLGDPLRFHHMLRVFKPTSPMSLGTWCLTVFSLPLTVAAILSVLSLEGPTLTWARRVAAILGILPALGAAVYKGVLLSTNAQPGWRDARWLGSYLANASFLLGCALLLALAVAMGEEPATVSLRTALGLLVVLNFVFLSLLLNDLRASLGRMYDSRQLWQYGLLILGAGALVPLFLVILGGPAALLAAVLLLLLGGLVIRFQMVNIPRALSDKKSV